LGQGLLSDLQEMLQDLVEYFDYQGYKENKGLLGHVLLAADKKWDNNVWKNVRIARTK